MEGCARPLGEFDDSYGPHPQKDKHLYIDS